MGRRDRLCFCLCICLLLFFSFLSSFLFLFLRLDLYTNPSHTRRSCYFFFVSFAQPLFYCCFLIALCFALLFILHTQHTKKKPTTLTIYIDIYMITRKERSRRSYSMSRKSTKTFIFASAWNERAVATVWAGKLALPTLTSLPLPPLLPLLLRCDATWESAYARERESERKRALYRRVSKFAAD